MGGFVIGTYIFRLILWIVVLLVGLLSLAISIYYTFKTYNELIVGVAVSLYIAVSAGEKIHALLKGKPEE